MSFVLLDEPLRPVRRGAQDAGLSFAPDRLGGVPPRYWEAYKLTYEHNDYLRNIGRLA